ncbi:M3 family oligoendopeptidase [Desmospora profundinema]|uniref:PepF/M3 family oligoendopeptidase n=1 Tax=Desmospora profundinema TaxID=1571184 RepID=A0ABU1IMN7_9BACL|nr:M3 family oligoendopeptidase [Desmospora profundinema]MDR6226055.1 pepF/M3 family oligoendopeptidase [Desmospora profundinema]
MGSKYSLTWDLDVFFPGGSQSPEFQRYLERLEEDVEAFTKKMNQLDKQASNDFDRWYTITETVQDLSSRLGQASAFIVCLVSQDVKDEKAKILRGRLSQLGAAFQASMNNLDRLIKEMDQDSWNRLLRDPRLQPLAFPLDERRRRAAEKLPSEQESLAGDLSVDGYHAWSDLYNAIVGRMTVPFKEGEEIKELSVGQAANKLSSPKREVRQAVFHRMNEAWERESELLASCLNHLGGFRLNLYRHRGWDSVLKEPLDINRMSEQTLTTMWEVISRNKRNFLRFFERKASLLGVSKLSWYDVYAPLAYSDATVGYDEAADFIMEHFKDFDPRMAAFARKAFTEKWIEAEDRPGKRPGGFCTNFPESSQSRIFMTFAGSASNVATLAHELGHAYHQHVMNDLPQMVQRYAMNVAETASTFAESIVADASIKNAATREQKISLLEDKVQRAVAFFMDIHARFLFETRFYEERRKGLVSVDRLKELIVQAEKEAFCDGLDEYHPYFWASKLHFYITGVPFYNFPYTFGYLFSTGIYGLAKQQGPAFAQKYVDLLRDTGRMTVEDLAHKHLGVDLTKPQFWQGAVDLVKADLDQFLELTKED